MTKKILSLVTGAAAVLGSATASLAALTAEQQAVVDSTTTLVTDMTGVAWAFVLTITGAIVGIGIFKKFFKKGVQ